MYCKILFLIKLIGIYGKAGVLESSDYDSSDEEDEESILQNEEVCFLFIAIVD